MSFASLFRRKTLAHIQSDLADATHSLKRVLGPWHLIALGIGAVIGAGIFASVGTAAAGDVARPGAGPALVISFLMTAVACGFAGLCYSEFAAMVPISGSAYTYSYATLGEFIAWIIGWDLIVEYAVGNIAVAISWAGYFKQFLAGFGIHIPLWLCTDLRTALSHPEILQAAPHIGSLPIVFNLPAAGITMLLTVILVIGIKESSWFNVVMVAIKLVTLAAFVGVGFFYIRPENWHPFAPNGWAGISAGAAIIFFSYIGFDAVSTVAEECKNPARDMPIGIIGSLLICTVIYVIVTLVITGMVPFSQLNVPEPLALALHVVGADRMAGWVSLGAVVATTAVLLVFQLGQPRIFFSMARDGLLPSWAAKVHPRFRTPHVTTILTGLFVAFFSAFASLDEMIDLCNIGTLFAFILVCIGVVVMRYQEPNQHRPFRVPALPLVALLGASSCFFLAYQLPRLTWWRFVIWLAVGMLIYIFYGRKHSRLNTVIQRT